MNSWERYFREHNDIVTRAADNYPDDKSIEIDYWELDRFDSKFADDILEHPDKLLGVGESTLKSLFPPDKTDIYLTIRIKNLPEVSTFTINEIGVEQHHKLISVPGIIRRASEKQLRLTNACYECLRCNNRFFVKQDTLEQQVPPACKKLEPGDCGRSAMSTSLKYLKGESIFADSQRVDLTENPEGMLRAQPVKLKVLLTGDQVGRVEPGDKVNLIGILSSVASKSRSKSTLMNMYLRVNNIEKQDYRNNEIEYTDEEITEFRVLSRTPLLLEKLAEAFGTNIHGYETEKLALVLQLFDGVPKAINGNKKRGDIHILLIGDPGTAKTEMLNRSHELSTHSIFTAGKTSSGPGLSAAAVRDETGQWTLEAGAMVMADRGHLVIDEFDKMSKDDRNVLHEGMEQQKIHVAKAGIIAALNSRCSMLAAANPKHGRFDAYMPTLEQIDLPSTIISRFDAIFPILDKPQKERDINVVMNILDQHGFETSRSKNEIDQDLLKRYIHFAKTNIKPALTKEATDIMMDYYVSTRESNMKAAGTVAIDARQFESLIRFSEASARARLSEQVTEHDAEVAINITNYFLSKVASDNGILDIDMITTGISTSKREKSIRILDAIGAGIDREGLLIALSGDIPESELDSILERLARENRIYSPRDGFWRLV